MTSHRFSLMARAAVVAGALITTAACSDGPTGPKRMRALPGNISAVDNPDLLVGVDNPDLIVGVDNPDLIVAVDNPDLKGGTQFQPRPRFAAAP